jgi:hypothetical protein
MPASTVPYTCTPDDWELRAYPPQPLSVSVIENKHKVSRARFIVGNPFIVYRFTVSQIVSCVGDNAHYLW